MPLISIAVSCDINGNGNLMSLIAFEFTKDTIEEPTTKQTGDIVTNAIVAILNLFTFEAVDIFKPSRYFATNILQ